MWWTHTRSGNIWITKMYCTRIFRHSNRSNVRWRVYRRDLLSRNMHRIRHGPTCCYHDDIILLDPNQAERYWSINTYYSHHHERHHIDLAMCIASSRPWILKPSQCIAGHYITFWTNCLVLHTVLSKVCGSRSRYSTVLSQRWISECVKSPMVWDLGAIHFVFCLSLMNFNVVGRSWASLYGLINGPHPSRESSLDVMLRVTAFFRSSTPQRNRKKS